MGAVAIAGEDEQVGALGGGDELPFDTSDAVHAVAGTPQSVRSGPEERLSGGGGLVFEPCAGIALGMGAAEEAGVGAVCRARDVSGADVKQDDPGAFGRVGAGGIGARTTG
ncbi:hypothetical protein [Saccharopolyspora pogona]|uniref:hypothetical protein n=1 Tax=Saccharopolyspora pogona TaxID=333966 RepID=UPI001684522C|nr:hypothetical protein [Saccharopolyspora pogona]